MSGFEINKLIGGALVALLLVTAINVGVDEIFQREPLEKPAYPIRAAGGGETGNEEAAAPASETTAETASSETTEAKAQTAADGEEPASGDAALAARLAAADPEAGRKIARKCASCHDLSDKKRNKVGPALWGVVGRPKGKYEGYTYSTAFQNLDGVWTFADLDAFLAKPKDAVPGTKMSFSGLKKPEDRANLLAFLATLGDSPAPLPGQ